MLQRCRPPRRADSDHAAATTCIRTACCQPVKPPVSWRRHCVHVFQSRFGGTSCGGFATSCCPSSRSSLGHTCPAQNQRCEPSAKHACFTDLGHHDQSKNRQTIAYQRTAKRHSGKSVKAPRKKWDTRKLRLHGICVVGCLPKDTDAHGKRFPCTERTHRHAAATTRIGHISSTLSYVSGTALASRGASKPTPCHPIIPRGKKSTMSPTRPSSMGMNSF